MAIFFTADNHFSDQNALKYRYRPFKNIDEMDETMVTNWNRLIGPDDTVYHLGDFVIKDKDIEKFTCRLNCKNLILIIGNHDYKRDRKLLLSYFDEVIDNPFELKFDKEYDIYNEGDSLWLAHYPLQRHDNLYSVCGHIHDLWGIAKRMINVGVDAHHFRPIPLEQVLASRHSEIVGHWDANVYPDADLEWQYMVSNKIQRDGSGGEPTMDILNKKMIEEQHISYVKKDLEKSIQNFATDICGG